MKAEEKFPAPRFLHSFTLFTPAPVATETMSRSPSYGESTT